MSYHRKHLRRSARLPMGDVASTIGNLISSIGSGASAVGNIASDPYLPEVMCRINQLGAIKNGQPVPTCVSTPSGQPGGVGLSDAILPLRFYVYGKQNKWVFPVAIAAVLGIPFFIGYSMGKG